MSLEVITTPFGQFQIDPRDIIGSTLKAGTLWDGPGFLEPIALEYGRLGEKGVTILDVGANLGSFSVWLAHHGAWRVLAIEPVPETMRQLKANLDLNKAVTSGRVIPIEVAAFDFPCQMRLRAPIDPGNPGSASLVVDGAGPIQGVPLDTYRYLCGGAVSLIKIDAQGCDGPAILGLMNILQKDRPVVVFEWEQHLAISHGPTMGNLLRHLEALRYDVHPWPTTEHNYIALPRP